MKAQDDKGPADNQADSSEPVKPPSAFEAAKGGELATLQRQAARKFARLIQCNNKARVSLGKLQRNIVIVYESSQCVTNLVTTTILNIT